MPAPTLREGFLEEAAFELGLGEWLALEVGKERKGTPARGRKQKCERTCTSRAHGNSAWRREQSERYCPPLPWWVILIKSLPVSGSDRWFSLFPPRISVTPSSVPILPHTQAKSLYDQVTESSDQVQAK